MSCDDCAICRGPGSWVVDPVQEARLDGALDQPCRQCDHELGAHELAAVRVALPDLELARQPLPGTPLARMQALVAARDAGLLTDEEYHAALRRLVRASLA